MQANDRLKYTAEGGGKWQNPKQEERAQRTLKAIKGAMVVGDLWGLHQRGEIKNFTKWTVKKNKNNNF